MQTLLTVLLVLFVASVVATLVTFLLVRRQLRRRNRVVADAPSPTPVSWLASPAAPARLHRRLRAAMQVATATPSQLTGVIDVRADLRDRALELDRRLATAGRAKGPRRRTLLRELSAEVDEVDAIAHRIDRLAARGLAAPSLPGGQAELEALAERLGQYEDAAAELEAIERRIEGQLEG